MASLKKTVIGFLLLLYAAAGFAGIPIFDVRDFGATGNKSNDATHSIQRAIDSAASKGGGTVFIPKGDYSSRQLRLHSNITLHIDAGATIYADIKNPAFKGGSLIYAENCKNITIKGKGTIDGQAVYVYENVRGTEGEISEEMKIARDAGVEMKRYYRAPGYAAAFNIVMRGCANVTIEDVSLINSSLWCMRIYGCDRIYIRGINVTSSLEKGVNSDGIDIDGSTNVHVTSSTVSVGDDAIVIKSGTAKWDGKGKINTSENIIVDNCVLTSSSAALKLGTESFGDMNNIIFSNCVIRNSNKGIEINVQDGANVSDIIFSNLTMELKRRHWNWWGDAQVFNFILKKRKDSSVQGSIRNVQINNVIAHAQGTSRIVSQLDKPMENFTISNMKVFMEAESLPDKRASNAMHFSNVSGLKLKDVEIYWAQDKTEPKWRSSLVLENVNGFEIQGLNTRQAFVNSSDPAVSAVNCTDGIIFNCIAQKNTGTFFYFEGGKTANIILGKNFTSNAKTAVSFGRDVRKKNINFSP